MGSIGRTNRTKSRYGLDRLNLRAGIPGTGPDFFLLKISNVSSCTCVPWFICCFLGPCISVDGHATIHGVGGEINKLKKKIKIKIKKKVIKEIMGDGKNTGRCSTRTSRDLEISLYLG